LALTAGSRIGAYEIISAIGAGGMGEVYRARDAKLARDVALKVLPAEFALDPDRLARFTREAQVLASLNHQNIAAIYGFEENALVLEFVDGPTLADRIAQGPIPLDEALPIARQIAEALEVAHEQGIVHRDLKPANIKVRPDGAVKVLDFGLAKLAAAGVTHAGSKEQDPAYTVSPTITTPAMTQVGMILGTAAYMSPEQAKGRDADKRSDIWAFGCVLFEMLTGKRAFEGDDVSDTLAAVLRAEPDWNALPAETPPRIRALLQRCLRKDVQKRLPHIAMARFDIAEASVDPAPLVTPSAAEGPRIVRRVIPLAIGIALTAAITSAAWWTLRPASTPPLVTRFAITLPDGQQFTGLNRQVLDVSRDGTQIVYAANRRLYRRAVGELDPTPIAGSEIPTGAASPVFSPDGRWIAFAGVASGVAGIHKIPSAGGTPQTVTTLGFNSFGLSWSSEGILIGAGARGIGRVSPNGGTPEALVTLKAGEAAINPRMLPGGDAVLYTRRGTLTETSEIVVHSLKSGEDTTVIKSGSDARYLDSGHLLYADGGVLLLVPFDLKQIKVTGEPVAVVNGVQRSGTIGVGGAAQFSVSSTGTLAYVPGPSVIAQFAQLDLAFIDRNGHIERLKLPAAAYEAPRVSPDGKQIAVSSIDAKEAVLWIYDVSGTTLPRKLTFGGRNRLPIWSGDSQRVAYQSDREGDLAIFAQRADGSGPVERLTKPAQGASHVPDSWSPDGEHLLFSETKGNEISSWLLSLRDKDKKVSPFGDIRSLLPINAVFSPNGNWVAYQSGKPGDNAVYVQPFPATGGGKQQISKGPASHHPAWTRDGKEIIYIPAQSNALVVSVNTSPSFSVSKTTLELPAKGREGGPSSIRNYDVMPDGRLLGVVDAESQPSGAPEIPQIRVVLNWFEELNQKLPH
jgi:serine/threonine-protein kinase